jgi:hypothetical protein
MLIGCAANCIVVNPTKSYYLLLNNTDAVISIDGKLIERVQYAKYLGVYIDDKLMRSNHVSKVIKSCCKRIGLFKNLSYFCQIVFQCYNFDYDLVLCLGHKSNDRQQL